MYHSHSPRVGSAGCYTLIPQDASGLTDEEGEGFLIIRLITHAT